MVRQFYRGIVFSSIFILCTVVMLSCGKETQTIDTDIVATEENSIIEETEECIEIPASDSQVETVYAELEDDRQLADFLIDYYQIPDEYLSEARYYYNHIDLNQDGQNEIFTVIVCKDIEDSEGYPSLLIQKTENGFQLIQDFSYIQTPIIISNSVTNGYCDIILHEYGGEAEKGYYIWKYDSVNGYTNDAVDFLEELDATISGTQIISNNFIDDLDKGNYISLLIEEEQAAQ